MSNGPLRLLGAGAGDDPVYVDDLFSTFLWTGDSSSSRSINNGIDLDGEGGLVWLKGRTQAYDHALYDTVRGATNEMYSNKTDRSSANSNALTSFNSNGFSIGSGPIVNNNAEDYVAWSFRKAKGFFDIVTYTGDGTSSRSISHNLGTTPGFVIVKRTDLESNWACWVRNSNGTQAITALALNATTASGVVFSDYWMTGMSSTAINLGSVADSGSGNSHNVNGATYVAYIFAHNNSDGEYGEGGDEDIIKCGTYSGNGSTGQFINLGFEPQFLLIKSLTSSHDWYLADVMRGMANSDDSTAHEYLYAQAANTEENYASRWRTEPTGFHLTAGASGTNASSNTYMYMAIRRSHKPVSEFAATDLYKTLIYTGDGSSSKALDFGFSPDLMIGRSRAYSGTLFISRLTGVAKQLTSHNNNAENSNTDYVASFDQLGMTVKSNFIGSADQLQHGFRRVKEFFDVVTYVGDGSTSHAVTHNLGVAPELIIVKNRTRQANWSVYHQNSPVSGSGKRYNIMLQADNAAGDSDYWPSTPTTTQFVLGDSDQGVNRSGDDYIAYLFATADGISKVGGYTGTDVDTDIDCGFSNGARFILIKRTDASGDWYVLDTVRGFSFGTDYWVDLNTTDTEENGNMINVESTGFNVSAGAGTNGNSTINILNATYIFLAIA